MRTTLLLLALAVCGTGWAQGDPSGDPTPPPPVLFPNPPLCDLSGDWYPIDRNGQTHMRTNHSLACVRLRFTNTTTIGFEWNINFIQFAYFSPGTISWRIIDDTGAEWQHGYQIFHQTVLRSDLDPLQEYTLEVYTTSLPFPAATVTNAFTIERYRDDQGLQGAFFEMCGVLADAAVQFLPVVPEHPVLEAVIYGDSLADGVVPISATNPNLTPLGAMASWPRKAIEYVCANLASPRSPRIINHSFSGWWGCNIEYPFLGFPNERALRTAMPWAPPNFAQMIDRSHPQAPTFDVHDVELVIYQLAQNDIGTHRLMNGPGYVSDIITNVLLMKLHHPNAKIVVCSTHLESHIGTVQRSLMHDALDLLAYRDDPDLHFVDTGTLLSEAGLPAQAAHPPVFTHEFWGITIGEEIRAMFP